MTTYLIAALIFGAAGWLAFAKEWRAHRGSKALANLMLDLEHDNAWVFLDRLSHLRRNAYLTDEDGVRRRYAKVSQVVRDKAEGRG